MNVQPDTPSYAAIIQNPALFPTDVVERLNAATVAEDCIALTAKSGAPTFSFLCDGERRLMHSAYNPEAEARTLAKDLAGDAEVDAVVVIGIGAGHGIRAALEARPNARILAIEPSYDLFRFIVESFDLSDIFSNTRVMYFVGGDQLKDIEDYLSTFTIKKLKAIALRGYFSRAADFVTAYQKGVLDFVDRKAINVNTIVRFERLWTHNIASNVAALPFIYGINRFVGKFGSVPAIVVSAGPSLEKNVALLREAKTKALLIAVDTALKPLEYREITPHIAVAIDPQNKNAVYFRGVTTDDTILVMEASIHNEIVRNYKGPMYAVESIFPLAKTMMTATAPHGEVTMGGSVSTTAFDLAVRMGCDPIIMVGLDLSFPAHATHIKGSYHEENFFAQVGKLDSYESRIYNVLVAGNLKPEKNIYGETVFVDSRFTMYRNWYAAQAKQTRAKLYNATEGGVAIDGFESAPLREILDTLPERAIDLSEYFADRALTGGAREEAKQALRQKLAALLADVRAIITASEDALRTLRTLDNATRKQRPIKKYLEALDEIDREIQSRKDAKELVGMTMQRAINTITGEYSLADEEGETDAARSSRYLYRQMLESAKFNEACLSKALRRLEIA